MGDAVGAVGWGMGWFAVLWGAVGCRGVGVGVGVGVLWGVGRCRVGWFGVLWVHFRA